MKKLFILLSALVATVAVQAADNIVVKNVEVPQGGKATVEVELNNPDHTFTAFQMALQLPEGISGVLNEKGKLGIVNGDRFDDHALSSSVIEGGFQFACLSNTSAAIEGTSGVLFSFDVQADASLQVGSELTAKFTGIAFTTTGQAVEVTLEDAPFVITVGEPLDPRTLLDENSMTAPAASEGAVDVRVKRTINANTWSTICLPFALTAAQMQEVFGEGVELGDFSGYETAEDDDENIVGITVNFTTATAIEANHPYIIKVKENVTEFTVDGVEIDPEDEPTVAAVKRTKKQWSEMIGTYVAGTVLESQTLFLSDSKFWYSAGATKIKGYRAYFDFYDVLTQVEEDLGVKMAFIDGVATRINEVNPATNGSIYDLSGRKVNRAQKGVYVIDGKKVIK